MEVRLYLPATGAHKTTGSSGGEGGNLYSPGRPTPTPQGVGTGTLLSCVLLNLTLPALLILLTGCGALGFGTGAASKSGGPRDAAPVTPPPTMLKAVGPSFPAEADEQWFKVSKDLNHDGVGDYHIYYASETKDRIVRDVRDLNFDGRPDMWRFFSPSGTLVREEMDLDFDGQVDLINIYDPGSGMLVLQEMAMGFQGRLSGRRILRDGKVITVEYDTTGDGLIDTWEFYEKQKLVRIGKSTNNDGKQDSFIEPDPSLTGQTTLVFPVRAGWTGTETEKEGKKTEQGRAAPPTPTGETDKEEGVEK